MSKHPNEWYLEGLKNQNPEVLRTIFQEFLPMVVASVAGNQGTKEDAKDIFMDAVEAIYRKVQRDELVLTAAFSTYLFEICKHLWYKRLRRKKFESGVTPDDAEVFNRAAETELPLELTEQYKLLREKFEQLQDDCRKVLSLSWHQDISMEDIAAQMGWTYGYARKRKHQCKEHLIALVRADRRYEELRA